MSGGFNDPLVGGGGALVYPSIHSPNFITGSAGWTIKKDGSAEFNNVTVRGTVTGGHFIGTGTGLEFVIYSGTPAAGNVLCSAISSVATDSQGNALLQDFAVYGQVGSPLTAMRMQETGISYYTATSQAGPWSLVSSIDYVTAAPAHLDAGGGVSRLDLNSSEIRAYANVEAAPGGTLETWHTVGAAGQPAFGVGFANGAIGAAAAGFQREPIGGGRVRLRGAVALTANQVGGATMFTLPAGYHPASTQFFDCTPTNLSGYAKSTGSVVVATSGAVTINCAGTNGNFVGLDGIVIELDN